MTWELVFGAEGELKWAFFWTADGTVYGDGLLRKVENRRKGEKRKREEAIEKEGGDWQRRGSRVPGLREILAGEGILCFYRHFCLKNLGTITAILSFLVLKCFCFRLLLFLSALYCLGWIL